MAIGKQTLIHNTSFNCSSRFMHLWRFSRVCLNSDKYFDFMVNDRLTACLHVHVGKKRGFNLHVGVILRSLVLTLNDV